MVHVIPENDVKLHTHSQDCLCEPFMEYIDSETGLPYPGGPIVTHNSYDGREYIEQALGIGPLEPDKGWSVWDE